MNKVYSIWTLLVFLSLNMVILSSAQAQLDAASSLLLKRGTSQSEGYNLNSGRYTVKDAPSPTRREEPSPARESVIPTNPVEPQENPQNLPLSVDSDAPADAKVKKLKPQVKSEEESKTFKDRVEDIVLGGDTEEIEKYRRDLPNSDRRKNILEISVAPTYIYNDSSSNYWFRDYSTSGPGLSVQADIWLTAFFAIDINYTTSLSTEVRADPDGTKYVLASHDWFGGGLKFRRFLSHAANAPSLIFAVGYEEYQFKVPYGELQRYRLKTSGVKLSVLFDMYRQAQSSWQVGMALYPRNEHKEVETGAAINSGTDVDTNAIAFSLGQTFTFNRSMQVFWKLSHKLEKNVFEGDATQADPVSGVTPEGVAVTNGFTLFSLGFTWGQ